MGSDDLFHKKKMRTAEQLARRAGIRSNELIKIICEGTETEVNYLQGFRKNYKLTNVHIEACPWVTDPINIVEYAIKFGGDHPEFDRIFCVFDHDNREQACEQAINIIQLQKSENQVHRIIISRPCFELWFLMHFIYTSKPLSKDTIVKELKKYLPNYEKNSPNLFNQLEDKLQIAINTAKKLVVENQQTESKNPATNMHELVSFLLSLKPN